MKRLFLSTVALLGLSVAASAQTFTWTGFYVGVNAGYGWQDDDDGSLVVDPLLIDGLSIPGGTVRFDHDFDDDDDGFVGGAQIGYNFQWSGFMIGVEADIQASDLGGDGRDRVPGTFTFFHQPQFVERVDIARGSQGLDWFATIRARAGVVFDRALVYATGGFAFGGGGDDHCGGFGLNAVCGDDDARTGYAVGGGVEYAFTNNLTVGLEGLYINLDNHNGHGRAGVFHVPTNTIFVNHRDDLDFGVVRAKINFKF